MRSKKMNRAAVLICALSSSVAWAGSVPAPDVPKREPASVASSGVTAKLSVKPLTTDILEGDLLGHVSLGLFCVNEQPRNAGPDFVKGFGGYAAATTNQELKRLGYKLADHGQANAFDTDLNAAPDFRIGGIIREVKFETCAIGADHKGWAYVKIAWALYSEKEQKVVLERTTEGVAKSDDRVPDLTKRSLVAAIDNFLADPAFTEQLKATPPANSAAASAPASTGKVSGLTVADLKTTATLKGGA